MVNPEPLALGCYYHIFNRGTDRESLFHLDPSVQFGNLFNAYAKWYNYRYTRSGSLLEHPFHRKAVTTDAYYRQLITYIHRNPQHHGLVDDFRHWPWSSYAAYLSSRQTHLQRDLALDGLGGRDGFLRSHEGHEHEELSAALRLE